MELKRGLAVISRAGNDKNGIFVVTGIDGNFVFLVDGKKRKLENPKKKNIKHIVITKKSATSADLESNASIRHFLKEIR